MNVLLSIKPKFVEAILDGRKRFEFRKSVFKRGDVNRVLIYSSSPVRQIVATFRVGRVLHLDPQSLWNATSDYSGITEEEFFAYYHGKDEGYALEIMDLVKLESPVEPRSILEGFTPPQSFSYVSQGSPLLEAVT